MVLGAEALLGPSNGAGQGKAGGVQKGCIQAVPEQQKQQLIKQLDWSKNLFSMGWLGITE